MTKKELRKYYGHPFGPVEKPLRIKMEGNWVFDLDRNESIIRIYPTTDKLKEVEKNFTVYSATEWIKKGNELFRGQPLKTALDNAINFLDQCVA